MIFKGKYFLTSKLTLLLFEQSLSQVFDKLEVWQNFHDVQIEFSGLPLNDKILSENVDHDIIEGLFVI